MHPLAQTLYQSIAFAQIAKIIPRIPDPLPSPVKGELINWMMPGVHLLTLVSVLDQALEEYANENDVAWPPKTKRDLFNRINVLSGHIPALDKEGLHRVRELRNRIAHPTGISAHASVKWSDIDVVVDVATRTVLTLGFDQCTRKIEAFFERTPTLYLDELGPNGERVKHSHRIGATIDNEVFLEYEVEVSHFPLRAT
jgi:hypothetical protein